MPSIWAIKLGPLESGDASLVRESVQCPSPTPFQAEILTHHLEVVTMILVLLVSMCQVCDNTHDSVMVKGM